MSGTVFAASSMIGGGKVGGFLPAMKFQRASSGRKSGNLSTF